MSICWYKEVIKNNNGGYVQQYNFNYMYSIFPA